MRSRFSSDTFCILASVALIGLVLLLGMSNSTGDGAYRCPNCRRTLHVER